MSLDTISHLYRWAAAMERDDDAAFALAESMRAFCERHDYDPCERGTDWPTVRSLMERERA